MGGIHRGSEAPLNRVGRAKPNNNTTPPTKRSNMAQQTNVNINAVTVTSECDITLSTEEGTVSIKKLAYAVDKIFRHLKAEGMCKECSDKLKCITDDNKCECISKKRS